MCNKANSMCGWKTTSPSFSGIRVHVAFTLDGKSVVFNTLCFCLFTRESGYLGLDDFATDANVIPGASIAQYRGTCSLHSDWLCTILMTTNPVIAVFQISARQSQRCSTRSCRLEWFIEAEVGGRNQGVRHAMVFFLRHIAQTCRGEANRCT